MSNIRTISGIPQELWDEFRDKHDNASGRIKHLMREDLEKISEDPSQLPNRTPIEDSDLRDLQKKAVRQLLKDEITEKNAQQFRTYMEKFYSQRDHKKSFRTKIINTPGIPYTSKGRGGIQEKEIECNACEAKSGIKALKNCGWECPKCGLGLFDVE
jgi:hypothetical protein